MGKFCKHTTETKNPKQEVVMMCGAKDTLYEGTPCLFTPSGASYCWYHKEVDKG